MEPGKDKDKYRYFRIEARELLEKLGQGVLELEKSNPEKDLVGRILRLAHTLKGASRVVKLPEIAQNAHNIEDALAAYRDKPDTVPRDQINQVLSFLDAITSRVASLDVSAAPVKQAEGRQTVEESFETVRVEIAEADRLLDGVAEASVQLTALRREGRFVEQVRLLAGNLRECLAARQDNGDSEKTYSSGTAKAQVMSEELCLHLERLERNIQTKTGQIASEFSQVRESASRLRLLPARMIVASLDRAVRDASQVLQKDVAFTCSGGDIRLDAHILTSLRDALLHVVRNAVAHGIETPAQRVSAGKASRGTIELRIERRANRVAFTCSDDGRGIDVGMVRQLAVRKGLVPAQSAESLQMDEAIRILMKGGISTSNTVDEVSGRGIGLDVVRETASKLKGQVVMRSVTGRGTEVEICVPVLLSSLAALEVDASGTVAALPLEAVREIKLISEHEIARSSARESIVYEGKVIPFLILASALRQKERINRQRKSWTAVVLEATTGTAAVGVDRLLGTLNIVVKPLPVLLAAEPVIAGASLDSEGNPQMVLDPEELVLAASREEALVQEIATTKPPAILIVDDSLTTRMLEQSILESAGYEVELATSGEEGLTKARNRQYGLFLVDVEMPGIDGFEFVSLTQKDSMLRSVPSILVTSRSAPEDRRRGEQAGARDYIVKGEFDQEHLLKRIRELVG